MYDLLPAPTVAKEMIFHPTESETILAGFEGGLIKTINNGESWQTVIDTHESSRFFFGIARDPADPSTICAGGWIKSFDDPQPFILYRSTNNGDSWKTYESDEIDFGGIYDMVWTGTGENKRLLAGLHKGGIYEISFEQ